MEEDNTRIFLLGILILSNAAVLSNGNPDAKRLFDDLLSSSNKLVRPVINVTDPVTVKFKLKLSQLIDVNLRKQVMTTNLWIEQYWYDYKLTWNPDEYGGVDILHVPSTHIWLPDIVLYNNADGNFEVTLATKATLYHEGRVEWKPPAIYHSSCEMDVEYFPFDEQTCVMKFGSWTYDGFQVDLRHKDETKDLPVVEIGIDLTEFYQSVEWDILSVPAQRNVKFYTCCDEPYLDITFNITMRRKTLFYTVNLIIPCMGISFLTVLVFYLPSDSGEKVSLSISILLSLTVFFLLLAEIIPPTSLVVPLLGKFVLFTMILDTFSICVTVVVLNIHFRSPQTHTMAPWVRRVFIHILPRLLVMRRPQPQNKMFINHTHQEKYIGKPCNGIDLPDMNYDAIKRELLPMLNNKEFHNKEEHIDHHGSGIRGYMSEDKRNNGMSFETSSCKLHGEFTFNPTFSPLAGSNIFDAADDSFCPELVRAVEGVRYIAEITRREEDSNKVKEDWKYVAMVLDRLFLWIFTIAVIVGTAGIILQAPTLYDTRPAIDEQYSEIETPWRHKDRD
jgi:nicotinic acetylcholine receptor